jgi:hypothetical protein
MSLKSKSGKLLSRNGHLCTTCCAGCSFSIQFYYLYEWHNHHCQYGNFLAYVGTNSTTGRFLGEVNLSNGVAIPEAGSDGPSVYSSWFPITSDDLTPTGTYKFHLLCNSSTPPGCHWSFMKAQTTIGWNLGYPGAEWDTDVGQACNYWEYGWESLCASP